MNDYDHFLDHFHAACPDIPIGVSEYGVDTNTDLHSAQPPVRDYSEEYQALYSETVYQIFDSKDYLWEALYGKCLTFPVPAEMRGGKSILIRKVCNI